MRNSSQVITVGKQDRLQCLVCQGQYELVAFGRLWEKVVENSLNGELLTIARYKKICNRCTARDSKERGTYSAIRTKAGQVRFRHADKFISLGIARDRNDFYTRFDWDRDRIIQDILEIKRCGYCNDPFKDYYDMTLDIRHTNLLPEYGSNTVWICRDCNTTKGAMTMEKWVSYRKYLREYAKTDPTDRMLTPMNSQASLFDGVII